MRLLRPSLLYGKHGRLGVGRTKFFEDYVHRNDGAVEQFIAGTSVRRLKLVKIGQRAVAAISEAREVYVPFSSSPSYTLYGARGSSSSMTMLRLAGY